MIAAIRISGQVGLRTHVDETLFRLRIRRKYACVVIKPTDVNLGMIKKLRSQIAYGEISDETFAKLIEARGQIIDKTKPVDAKKAVEELKAGKTYEEVNLKPFFRLHPARGGIETKKHFPKGVLGDHKADINKLIEKML